MYDSKPKEREGESIEDIVPEAVSITASKDREGKGRQEASGPWLAWLPGGRGAFAVAAAVAVIEALVFILIAFL